VASSFADSGTWTGRATDHSRLRRPPPSRTQSASTCTSTGIWTPPQQRHRRRRRSSYPAARHRITAAFTHTAIGCYTRHLEIRVKKHKKRIVFIDNIGEYHYINHFLSLNCFKKKSKTG